MGDFILNEDRTKQIGQAIATQRETAEKTVVKTAALLDITPDEYLQFERGEKSPSLPQLEALSYFFKIPLITLLEPQVHLTKPRIDLAGITSLLGLRDKVISSVLKKSRLEKEITIEDLASRCGLNIEDINSYELNQAPIPLPILETLCSALEINIESLFSSISIQAESTMQPSVTPSTDPTMDLPNDMATFFADRNNLPYLELAKKLSRLDAARIREIAESLLEITY